LALRNRPDATLSSLPELNVMFEHMSLTAVIFTVACVDLFVHSEQIRFNDSFALDRPKSTELNEYLRMLELVVQPSTSACAIFATFLGSDGFRVKSTHVLSRG
jgi:hypothetical protein